MTEATSYKIETEKQKKSKAPHIFFFLCVFMFVAFWIWAATGTLNIVSYSSGEVVPKSKVQQVQHLEGGIVRIILVKEGGVVKRGDAIIELETTRSFADVSEMRLHLASLQVDVERLELEAKNQNDSAFSEAIIKAHPTLVSQAKAHLKTRRNSLNTSIKEQTQLIAQRKQDIEEVSSRIKNQKKQLTLLQEQIKISEELLKDELTNRYKHIELLKDANKLESSIEENTSALKRAEAAMKQAEAKRQAVHDAYNEEVRDKLNQSKQKVTELQERLLKVEDSLEGTTLRSPVDGTIKTLNVTNQGGVIRPGAVVAEIVPIDDRLIIEAQLQTRDIGYVKPGQDAQVTLTTIDSRRYEKLIGNVDHISPDTLINDKGQPYYMVRILTDKDHFYDAMGDRKHQLIPGMQVSVNILTGERTVLEYILDPFMSRFGPALSER